MKLVFLHGAGSSSLSFYYQLRHFRNSKAIDLPGHPTGKACESIEGYLEWVRGFNTARRYKDVILCGHSMGGAIAQLYALRYPDELKGIILIGTGARLRVRTDIMDEVSNIHLPTQVVCGSDDEMTPVKYSDYLGSQISEADVQVIPGGTHYVQLEKYQKVNEQIERFLGSLK